MLDRSPRRHHLYDHRLRNAVVATGDATLFAALRIPDSTARSWIARGPCNAVTLEADSTDELLIRVAHLQRKCARLTAVLALLVALLRVRGARLSDAGRLPEGGDKQRLLQAIARARRAMPLTHALRVVGLSSARYHEWRRRETRCALDDAPSCPRTGS